MKVMEIRDAWGLENLRCGTRPDPVPGEFDVVVEMQAASINYRDLVMVRGGYGRKGGQLPMIPVSDGAGKVVAVGKSVLGSRPAIWSARISRKIGSQGPFTKTSGPECSADTTRACCNSSCCCLKWEW